MSGQEGQIQRTALGRLTAAEVGQSGDRVAQDIPVVIDPGNRVVGRRPPRRSAGPPRRAWAVCPPFQRWVTVLTNIHFLLYPLKISRC